MCIRDRAGHGRRVLGLRGERLRLAGGDVAIAEGFQHHDGRSGRGGDQDDQGDEQDDAAAAAARRLPTAVGRVGLARIRCGIHPGEWYTRARAAATSAYTKGMRSSSPSVCLWLVLAAAAGAVLVLAGFVAFLPLAFEK